MILKSINPRHFGPFSADTTLHLDPDVTVLTGPNDVGKSLALRAIQLLCTENAGLERERNRDRIGEFNGTWADDPEMTCEAVFEVSTASKKGYFSKDVLEGDLITVKSRLNQPGRNYEIVKIHQVKKANRHETQNMKVRRWPEIVSLPLQSELRENIDLGNMTEAEQQFVRLGFGAEFSVQQHTALEDINRTFRIAEVEAKLNARLTSLFPPTLPFRFLLREVSGKPDQLGVMLVDQHQGHTPLASRGAGVRRLMNVMGTLLRMSPDMGHTIVLYDEPETSLHADAQHRLRRLLETLGAVPTIQVVYTTHSPAMINTLRPHSVRVLKRERVKDKATSLFVNQALAENYALVRSSLGVSPADSLLYSPITIVVEGPTEVRCIPFMLKKLADAGAIESSLLDILLPQTHILDGEGASFEYMIRLAKSQNAHPIVFLDGDKVNEANSVKVKHPDVEVIILDKDKEFEDLIPKAAYIQAAAVLVEIDPATMTEEAFTAWDTLARLRSSVMFSKRIERWLRDEFDKSVNKPLVMQRAIELTEASGIVQEPFQKLVEAMKNVAMRI